MSQEASWVGLGWNLNPGAINRTVSGVPDDWKNGTKYNMIYDVGGEISHNSLSFGIGYGKYSLGFNTTFAKNKAFGGEVTYSNSTRGSVGFDITTKKGQRNH